MARFVRDLSKMEAPLMTPAPDRDLNAGSVDGTSGIFLINKGLGIIYTFRKWLAQICR